MTQTRPYRDLRIVLRGVLAAAVGATILGSTMPALAERAQRPGAAELLRAMDLVREGRCDAAIPLLRQAHDLGDLRNALWNLAECYALMSRPRAAINTYRQYMEHSRTTAQDRGLAQAAIERIEATMARIEVTANVEGARVRVNGLDQGETPVTVEAAPGTCAIEVISPGFQPWSREIEVGAGQELSLSAELVLAPGELVVTSEPPGATVWIDGEQREGLTPWDDDQLTGGGHVVEIRREGYRNDQRQIDVDPGGRSSLDVELHPVEGTLIVASNANEATLRVGGEERGRSPFAPLSLSPGHYELEVRAEDHGGWRGEVDVFDQRTTTVELDLPSTEGVHRAWFWSATGVALTTFVVGAAFAVAGLYYNGEFQTIVQSIDGDHSDPFQLAQYREEGLELLDTVEAYAWASFGMIITAVVGALSMFFLGLFTRFRDSPAQSQVSIDESPGLNGPPAEETSTDEEEETP